ncbi:hypothetical protein HanRHA438_Chr05g0209761 [Helianthus annuus]|nr:hypothetical protein HanIR_Chr05g0215871 [Helianthus annuus]KAJ0917767.1 hypothetical protein HanRHA438_Chr05g0209761 [Helianthus annuus]
MLVFVWVYPIKKIFYIHISGFFHKKMCPSKYRALAGGPPRSSPGPAMCKGVSIYPEPT